MPKKKEVKPLFASKHAFVDSLDAFIQASMNLHQVVKTALDLGQIKDPSAESIKRQLEIWERATFTQEDRD